MGYILSLEGVKMHDLWIWYADGRSEYRALEADLADAQLNDKGVLALKTDHKFVVNTHFILGVEMVRLEKDV